MTALTFNIDTDFKRGRHAFAGFDGNLANGQINPNVSAEDTIRFFKPGTKLFHVLSAFTAFFGRLEHEEYLALNFVLQCFQHFSGTQ